MMNGKEFVAWLLKRVFHTAVIVVFYMPQLRIANYITNCTPANTTTVVEVSVSVC